MISVILTVLGSILLFVPYVACKIKGIDVGHPPFGVIHDHIDAANGVK